MYVPVMTNSRGGKSQVPAWLKLAEGEKFVRRWGRGCCGENSSRSTAISSVIAALATVVAGQVGAFDFDMFDANGEPTSTRWILIACFSAAMLFAIGIVIWSLARRSRLQAALTDRRIVFREKGRVAELALRDLTRLGTAESGSEKLVQFYTSANKRIPIASLPVKDPHDVLEEIRQQASEAGAELKNQVRM